jgi:head-tail adaptor
VDTGALPLMVASGKRKTLVTVQQLAESKGVSRFPVETWTALCSVWAHREDQPAPRRFREDFKADQLSALNETKWHLPYRADYDPDRIAVPKNRRLLSKGRVYDITSASVIEETIGGKQIQIMTVAKVD